MILVRRYMYNITNNLIPICGGIVGQGTLACVRSREAHHSFLPVTVNVRESLSHGRSIYSAQRNPLLLSNCGLGFATNLQISHATSLTKSNDFFLKYIKYRDITSPNIQLLTLSLACTCSLVYVFLSNT